MWGFFVRKHEIVNFLEFATTCLLTLVFRKFVTAITEIHDKRGNIFGQEIR